MKKNFVLPMLLIGLSTQYCMADELEETLRSTAEDCFFLSVKSKLFTAKLGAVISGIGTAGAGVALGAGIANSKALSQAGQENTIDESEKVEVFDPPVKIDCADVGVGDEIEVRASFDENGNPITECWLTKRYKFQKQESEILGKIEKRAATQATALGISGVMGLSHGFASLTNRSGKVNKSFNEDKDGCIAGIKVLSEQRLKAKVEKNGTDPEMMKRAEKLINACRDIEYVDWKSIDKPNLWAAVSSLVGGGTAAAGMVTGIQEYNAVGSGDIETVQKKNKTTNILAGTSAVASGISTLLSMKEISELKKVNVVVQGCSDVAGSIWDEINVEK